MDDILNVKVCARTNRSLKHKTNEDRFLIFDGETGLIDIKCYGRLYAVADGIDGSDNVTLIVIQV